MKGIDKIKEKMEEHEKDMKRYDAETREYITKYGNDNSDDLIHRRLISGYNRGAYNALLAALKHIGP